MTAPRVVEQDALDDRAAPAGRWVTAAGVGVALLLVVAVGWLSAATGPTASAAAAVVSVTDTPTQVCLSTGGGVDPVCLDHEHTEHLALLDAAAGDCLLLRHTGARPLPQSLVSATATGCGDVP